MITTPVERVASGCKSAAEAFEKRPPERELDGVARGCPHVRGRTASDASMLAKR